MSAGASPTLASWVLIGTAGALAGVIFGEPALIALAAPFAVAAIAALAAARRPQVELNASTREERVLEGDRVSTIYELREGRGAAWLELRVQPIEGLRTAPDDTARILRLAPGEDRRVEMPMRAERWGGYRAGGARVWVTGPLGGVWWRGAVAPHASVRVLPDAQRLRALVAPARTQAAVGTRRAPTRGDGLELAEVRPYAPGDPLRRMHWRATARTATPYVADRHPERSADVVLFLDAFAELPDGAREQTLTLAVRAAATLAQEYLRTRDRVGVVRFGGTLEWLRPGSGVLHAMRIADALARSEIVMTYVARDVTVVPPAILPARALVLAITALLDERGARALLDLLARGHDLAVVEIDAPALLGASGDPAVRLWALRRAAIRARLAELGAVVGVWDGAAPLESVLREVIASRRASRLPARA
ncbi:MAG TPA: DUF58 domain-containing protein [Solirubrobacteraceae bacterium]